MLLPIGGSLVFINFFIMSTTETSTVKVELLRRTPHGSPGDIVEVDILEFE